jgi:hypothetical protein
MFLTAELTEGFVTELVQLRDALGNIKRNTEMYLKQSSAAAKSLEDLNESLATLRALKLYKYA